MILNNDVLTVSVQRTTVLFNNYVDIYEIDDYDRKIEKTWTRLSQLEKVTFINDISTSVYTSV